MGFDPRIKIPQLAVFFILLTVVSQPVYPCGPDARPIDTVREWPRDRYLLLVPGAPDAETDIARALRGTPGIQKIFKGLTLRRRNGFIQWIDGTKNPDTRQRRIQKGIELLMEEFGHNT